VDDANPLANFCGHRPEEFLETAGLSAEQHCHRDPEPRKVAHKPGDVVDVLFKLSFSAVVGQRRIDRGVRDADMNDAAATCIFDDLDQNLGISDGFFEGVSATREPDPVGY
jgi:hypothetical protein